MTGLFHDPQNVLHQAPGHPERPERYTAIVEALALAGLVEKMSMVAPRAATGEEISRVHQKAMINRIEKITNQGGGMIDPDTFCTAESWDLARMAAGGITDLCFQVAKGELNNGLALPRPPGHHATATGSMGFCLVNHVALVARALQSEGLAEKIAIIDIDGHHGNGTEDIFAADPTVFFASTHQFPHYPGTGPATDCGTGEGTGYTLNIPLSQGAGDDAFRAAYREKILPAVEKFAPDFMVISAGYDAHRDDPLVGLNVSNEGFDELTEDLLKSAAKCCDGKIVFVLEGGYNLDVLATCLTRCASLLLTAKGASTT